MTSSFLVGTTNPLTPDIQKKIPKLFGHIQGYVKMYKQYPSRKYLASTFGQSEQEVTAMCKELVQEGKLQEENGTFYIPGMKTLEELQGKTSNIVAPVQQDKPIITGDPAEPINQDKPDNSLDSPTMKQDVFSVPEMPENETQANTGYPHVVEPRKYRKRTHSTSNKYNRVMFAIFKVVIFFVGVAFIYIGIKYNYHGNMLLNPDPIDAYIRSFAFMLVSIIFFEMWLFFWGKRKHICWIFLFGYIVLFLFNTGTILYYQYDKFQDHNTFSATKIQNKRDQSRLDYLTKTIADLESKQKNFQDKRELTSSILKKIDESDDRYHFNVTRNTLTSIDNELDKVTASLQKSREEKSKLESVTDIYTDEKKPLFSGWVLIFYLFLPSFAIELLASTCLALLLFIKFE